jgi:hypothetical protein
MAITVGPFLVLSASAQTLVVSGFWGVSTSDPVWVITPTIGTTMVGIIGGTPGRLWWALYGSTGAGNVINTAQEHATPDPVDRIASPASSMNNIGGVRLGMLHAYDATSQRWRRIA